MRGTEWTRALCAGKEAVWENSGASFKIGENEHLKHNLLPQVRYK